MNHHIAEREILETEGPRPAITARCPGPVVIELSRFPTHTTEVTALPPAERAKIRHVALLILQSFSAGCPAPFRRVIIGGHADRDVRMGPAFEMEVSRKRAESVRAALQNELLALGRGGRVAPPPTSGWVVQSFGATQLRARNPRGEADRLLNRRVAIQLIPTAQPPSISDNLLAQCLRHCIARKAQCLKHADPNAREMCLALAGNFCRTCARARPAKRPVRSASQ